MWIWLCVLKNLARLSQKWREVYTTENVQMFWNPCVPRCASEISQNQASLTLQEVELAVETKQNQKQGRELTRKQQEAKLVFFVSSLRTFSHHFSALVRFTKWSLRRRSAALWKWCFTWSNNGCLLTKREKSRLGRNVALFVHRNDGGSSTHRNWHIETDICDTKPTESRIQASFYPKSPPCESCNWTWTCITSWTHLEGLL